MVPEIPEYLTVVCPLPRTSVMDKKSAGIARAFFYADFYQAALTVSIPTMRLNDFIGPGILLMATLLSVSADAADISAAAGLLYFDYQEFSLTGESLNHETGALPGISVAAREKMFGLDHSLAFTFWQGQVDYRGLTQAGAPHTTKTEQDIYIIDYRLDWRPKDTAGGLYGKLGWQNWDRNIQPANGVNGLFERYQWWSLEAGLHIDLYQAGNHKLFTEFGGLATTHGTIKIDLRNSGYGYPTLDLGDGTGIAVRAGWSSRLDDKSSLSILFDYTRWDFDRSDSETIPANTGSITITEPESRSKRAGLSFIYQFSF